MSDSVSGLHLDPADIYRLAGDGMSWEDTMAHIDHVLAKTDHPTLGKHGAIKPYTLIWYEHSHDNQKEAQFSDFDEAKGWAQANLHPHNVNGSVMPNVPDHLFGDDDTYDGRRYESGVFAGRNRYAVIVQTGTPGSNTH